jgi:hypothetical protein
LYEITREGLFFSKEPKLPFDVETTPGNFFQLIESFFQKADTNPLVVYIYSREAEQGPVPSSCK